MPNLHSINTFPADGTRTEWDFQFSGVAIDAESGTVPYLYPADVYAQEVYIDGAGIPRVVARTSELIGPTRIRVLGAPIATGRTVKIYRKTEIRFPLVDYRDRQTVTESDLDLANRQAIFIAQETQDIANTSIVLDEAGNFDVNGRKIVNLAAGSDDGDAVNVYQFRHTLRIPASEPPLAELPNAAGRAGRVLTFDVAGAPQLLVPSNESALALAIRLASVAPGDGGDIVGWTDGLGNPRTVTAGLLQHESQLGTHSTQLTALEEAVLNVLYKGENLDPVAGSSLGRGSTITYVNSGNAAGSIRIGGSDLTDLNDELGFWRGLPSRNAWGDYSNYGFCSAAFNRNGASVAAYSTTFGHDCVTYGTASLAGGAGSCTGNPDVWALGGTPAGFTGYCAVAFGKNVYVPGQKAVGLGEAHTVNARAAFGLGYRVEVQNSALTPDPTGVGGIGREITVQGNGYGFGSYLSASDSMVLGYGANPGSPLQGQGEGEVGMGAGTTVPAVRIQQPAAGRVRSKVLVNTTRSSGFISDNADVTVSLDDSKSVAITGDGFGIYDFEFRGLKGDGTSQPIVRMRWSNPNSGSSDGEFSLYMNGRSTSALSVLSNGTVRLNELKNASTITGAPVGSLYQDGGVIKVVT